MKSYLSITLLLLLSAVLQGQTVIRDLSIESKKNGAYLRLSTSKPIDIRNTSGWIRKDHYFYLTLMNTRADSARIMKTVLIPPVKKFEVTHIGESTQFAFELTQPVESFDLYQSDTPPELLISLRFPLTEVLATLQDEKEESDPISKPVAIIARHTPGGTYGKVRNALYLTGASLAIAGIITQDNRDGISWEFPVGIGMLAGTYVYDKYIKPLI